MHQWKLQNSTSWILLSLTSLQVMVLDLVQVLTTHRLRAWAQQMVFRVLASAPLGADASPLSAEVRVKASGWICMPIPLPLPSAITLPLLLLPLCARVVVSVGEGLCMCCSIARVREGVCASVGVCGYQWAFSDFILY